MLIPYYCFSPTLLRVPVWADDRYMTRGVLVVLRKQRRKTKKVDHGAVRA
jgi:hypothetical protein